MSDRERWMTVREQSRYTQKRTATLTDISLLLKNVLIITLCKLITIVFYIYGLPEVLIVYRPIDYCQERLQMKRYLIIED